MARTDESGRRGSGLAHAGHALLALRPTFALIAVWLTTAGHTANFREMEAARGWIAAEGYSLHSIFLFAIALTLLAAPRLALRFHSYPLVVTGLVLLASGSIVNAVLLQAPVGLLELGRVLAGVGSGLVISAAPRIHPKGWESSVAWAGIVLPATGPVVLACAVDSYDWTSWEGGFLFEAALALIALGLVLSIADPPGAEVDQEPTAPLTYLPALIVGTAAVWYVMHWGQLHGWLEGPDIVAAVVLGGVSFSLALAMAWPHLDGAALREGWPRFGLVAFGGFVQYFNVSDMGVYAGLLINFSPWMRAWIILPLSIGAATALAAGRVLWGGRSPGYAGATTGLLVLAGGMALSHWNTMNWPFWDLLNQVDLHWFTAPQHWQLAPPRFLMGFGSGILLLSMTSHASRDPAREARLRPLLPVAQFSGGALSIGVLVSFLLIGHQWEYSYVADRGFIQPVEQADRRERLVAALTTAGAAAPSRQADALINRAVTYEVDNFVFADIYGSFAVAALVLAIPCGLASLIPLAPFSATPPSEG